MDRLIVAVVLVVLSVAAAVVINRRQAGAPFTIRHGAVPSRVRPEDVGLPAGAAIVIFTEATCRSCQQALALVKGPAGAELPVAEIEYGQQRPLHDQYGIDTVPTTVVVDAEGVVVGGWTGSVDPGLLAAALAEVV